MPDSILADIKYILDQLDRLKSFDVIPGSDYMTGYIADTASWVYASSTTLTITGDVTARFPVGTKIKLTQTTPKYFYVVSAVYGAPNTTLTLTGGSDYSLANAAITSPYYSYQATPQGFPQWFNWSAVMTGFSADPGSAIYRFQLIGPTAFLVIDQGTNGTSNSTDFTITLPITSIATLNQSGAIGLAVDNSTIKTTACRWNIGGSAVVMTLYTDMATGAWTNANGKRARLECFYKI